LEKATKNYPLIFKLKKNKMLIRRLIEWFKSKSIQESEKNIDECLIDLVKIANQAYENLQNTGVTNSSDIKAVQKAKDRLIIQLCGPIPLDEVKQRFITPLLYKQELTEGARVAINHAIECVEKSLKK